MKCLIFLTKIVIFSQYTKCQAKNVDKYRYVTGIVVNLLMALRVCNLFFVTLNYLFPQHTSNSQSLFCANSLI